MGTPTIKTTYALDAETVRALEDLARRWETSKSEALRRLIRAAAIEARQKEPDALQALDEVQRSLRLDKQKVIAWARRTQAERREAAARGERRGG